MENTDIPIPGIDSDDERVALEAIVQDLVAADKDQIKYLRGIYKKHDLFWHGIQKVVQDDISRDWVTPQGFLNSHQNLELDENGIEDRPINIYRAHGESIIAALSTGLPYVRFFPDDADNSADLNTAKASSKIAELVQRQNEAEILFIYALFLMYNQGVVFAYTYHDEDEKYGVITKQVQNGLKTEQIEQPTCPLCQYPFPEETIPDEMGNLTCESCGQSIPQDEIVPQTLELQTPNMEEVQEPKAQEKIELFGPLNVRVPTFCRKLRDVPYLCLEIEQHVSLLREIYPDFFERIETKNSGELYERWARENSEFQSKDVLTVRKFWLRPYSLNIYGTGQDKKEIIEALKIKYDKGVCVTFIEDMLVDAYDDDLDARWTATESPLDTKIHADPLGAPILPVQEIRTEFVELIVETVEQGIPHTFADPDVLDFDAYKENQNGVGMVHPAKARAGANLGNYFFTLHTATLSAETKEFVASLDADAQFVGGAFPSVFGGMLKGGSQTAAEYEMSRNQALQRLSTSWKVINSWWARVMEKCVRSYIEHVQGDEKIVKTSGDSYINSWIRSSELKGKIGGASSETSEQFPVSWVQKRAMLLELMGMNNPFIMMALQDVENANKANQLLMPDLKAPGTDDRDKQLAEIAELLTGQPYEEPVIDPMTGLPGFDPETGAEIPPKLMPSVEIDPEVDNHDVHIQVCKAWAVSISGRAAKVENPEGYANVIAHMMMHDEFLTMTAPPVPVPGAESAETQPVQ
jgi:hypothetical protein